MNLNDDALSRLTHEEYEEMEWLETKEDRGTITLEEKRELTELQLRWNMTE